MSLLFRYNKVIAVFTIFFLAVINIKTVALGLNGDLFGILFSVVLFIIGGRRTNFKINYLLVALILVFEFVSYRLHAKSLHFLSLTLFLCLIYHSFTRKFSFIAFICILLFSTLFNKLFEHLTTEIKQTLCYWVYLALKGFIDIDRIEGVNFYINDAKITIDTACMGLSMFKTGLLTAALLLTLEERKQQKYFRVIEVLIFCTVIIMLNFISNYFRIIILILLNCTNENILHHSVGLLCFVVYQVVPMLFLIRYFKPRNEEEILSKVSPLVLPIVICFGVILMTSLEIRTEQNFNLLDNLSPEYKRGRGQWVNDEVYKIETPEKLIYIKTPSHKPLICWTGDGYKITESKEIFLADEKIWFSKLEKNNVKYNSYWWYQCGNKKYTSFMEVLFLKLLYNKTVFLINETSIAR